MKKSPINEWWWQLLMDLRPKIRFFAERLPRLAIKAVRLRSVLHALAGNPTQVAISYVGAVIGLATQSKVVVATSATLLIGSEIAHHVAFNRGGPKWLIGYVGWREAWRFRRRFPSLWAEAAAKTSKVQAEVGTSKEPIASARLRPIADHPKMSWMPTVRWPIVSWWIGPPPGRSFEVFEQLTTVLAANTPRCRNVVVDYADETSSYGRLHLSFADALEEPSLPSWAATSMQPGDEQPSWDAEIERLDQIPSLRSVPTEEAS